MTFPSHNSDPGPRPAARLAFKFRSRREEERHGAYKVFVVSSDFSRVQQEAFA